ncbi:MAG: aquaporin [Chloroflexi bacterium]|nr:aquaporin [Chloroflexota bacterium]
MDWDRTWRASLAELFGAFGLIFMGAGSIIADAYTGGKVGLVGIALAHALVLGVVVSATMHLSGGHINPAVTLSFMTTGRIGVGPGIAYIVAQLIGATLAGLMLLVVFPSNVYQKVSLGATLLAPEIGFWTGVLIEAVLTFFLVFTVFATAVDPRGPKSIAGFGIGLVLAFDILAAGPLTGASINPARTFGPALAGGYWANHLVYWIGPIVGGVVAALIYELAFVKPEERGWSLSRRAG